MTSPRDESGPVQPRRSAPPGDPRVGAPYRVPARALRRGIARHHEAVVGLLVALLYAAEFVAFRHIDRALDVITLVALLAVLSEAPPRPRR